MRFHRIGDDLTGIRSTNPNDIDIKEVRYLYIGTVKTLAEYEHQYQHEKIIY